jgi:hypothetical protein
MVIKRGLKSISNRVEVSQYLRVTNRALEVDLDSINDRVSRLGTPRKKAIKSIHGYGRYPNPWRDRNSASRSILRSTPTRSRIKQAYGEGEPSTESKQKKTTPPYPDPKGRTDLKGGTKGQ